MDIHDDLTNSFVSGGPVHSFDEWSPLEAVIVGRAAGACVPASSDPVVRACVSARNLVWLERFGGQFFPEKIIESAESELDGLAEVLTGMGVSVYRPDPIDFTQTFSTPFFISQGLYSAMPRDVLITLGEEILEAPMAWRRRYFEHLPFRKTIQTFTASGGGWRCAPKPSMSPALYDPDYKNRDGGQYVTTEFEPCFDAADMIRCGRDVFIQRSQVTNMAGITWIRRHLPKGMRLHRLVFDDPNPMHLDSTLMPLRPGLLLVNPKRRCHQADLFREAGWTLVEAPDPALPDDWPLFLSSAWLSMNLLVVDERRILVEAGEVATIKTLESLGFDAIPVPFRHVYSLGGGLHCATCDLRRRGGMENYGFSDHSAARGL